jgi:multidrug resistance efflux pump
MSPLAAAAVVPVQPRSGRNKPTRRRPAGKFLLLPVAPLLLITGLSWLAIPTWHTQRTDLITHAVHYRSLQITIAAKGSLDAVDREDVVCRVKARVQGNTVASTIKWVIDEGTPVQRSQIVAVLDDSALQEDHKTQEIAVLQAQSAWAQAEEAYKIQLNQDQSDLETARNAVDLATIDLQKYRQGDYQQALKDVEGRLFLAESDLEMWRERTAWTDRMVRKGFLTTNQSRAEKARRLGAELALDNVREERRVLEQYTRMRTLTDLATKLATARLTLNQVKSQAHAREAQLDIDRLSKRSIYEHEAKRLREIEEQIRDCTLRAPHDGIAVYAISEQARAGRGSQQALVAQGEPVREGQHLLHFPRLNQLVIQTWIPEALLGHVHGEERERTGFGDSLEAALTVSPDPWTRLVNPVGLDTLRENFREQEERVTSSGEPVLIHVHAFPEKVLHGHVKSVGSIPSEREWWLTDSKLYPTTVALDESLDGLRLGMNADLTILGDDPLEHVLAVPVEALTGMVKRGEPSQCFVLTPVGPQERAVVVGQSNDTMVEIRDGLQEGEEVVLNPGTLLKEHQGALSSSP